MQISNVNHTNNSAIKNQKKKRNTGASISAAMIGGNLPITAVPLSLGIVNKVKKIQELPQDKIDIMHKAAQSALDNTGLTQKGVKITYIKRTADDFNLPQILKLVNPIEQIKDGKNAAFLNQNLKNCITKEIIYPKNTILMHVKDLSGAAFHEIGHALNYNFSKFGKALQIMRTPLTILASCIALYGAFTNNSKPEEGKELNKKQKIKNFIRNNAGKLSFAAMLPILLEEGMATFKGQKLANQLLSKDMAKIVSKSNKIGGLTYILNALVLGAGAFATVKIKDHIVAKKENKSDNKSV